MNTALQTFQFQSHQLTVITDEHDASWFIAKEVAEILEYSDAEAMTRKLDEDEVQNLQIVGFGNRGVNVINESGLWSSVLRSTKPEAKTVKKWLTSEVLPSIHKTGSYIAPHASTAHLDELLSTQRLLIESQQDQIAYVKLKCDEAIAQAALVVKEAKSNAWSANMQKDMAVRHLEQDRDEWESAFYKMERSKYPIKPDEAAEIFEKIVGLKWTVREVAELHYRTPDSIRKAFKNYVPHPAQEPEAQPDAVDVDSGSLHLVN